MITGRKIVLREFRAGDIDRMHQWVNNRDITRHLAFAVFPRTLSDCSEFLKRQLERKDNSYINFVIAERSSPDIYIGSAGLKHIDYINRKAELSIVIGFPEYHEKGYGSEATELIVRYGFESLNLHKLCLKCVEFNNNAIRVYEKAGFTTIGELKDDIYIDGEYYDQVYMEIMKNDYLARRKNPKQYTSARKKAK